MGVPLLDLSRQHGPLAASCAEKFAEVYASGRFILGAEVEALEAELAAYTGIKEVLGLSSGTDALLVAMMAMGIGPGDEVLCPVFTFFGTAGSIVRAGATPVWVDVRPGDFNIDLEDAAAKVTERTRAIVPVHLFGQAADMECVQALADRHGLKVLEDLAQALGARIDDRVIGGIGECGITSFYPTKNFGGFGDGGALMTNDSALAERVRRLRNHGMHPRYLHHEVGGNFRLDSLQAALLRIKLPHLEDYHEARAAHAAVYLEALADCDTFELPAVAANKRHVWNQFTLKVKDGRRDALQAHLAAAGIGSEIYYPLSLDQQPCFKGMGRGQETISVSHELARSVLSIPVFPEMTEAEQAEVIAALRAFRP